MKIQPVTGYFSQASVANNTTTDVININLGDWTHLLASVDVSSGTLGVAFFTLLVQVRPFPGSSWHTICTNHQTGANRNRIVVGQIGNTGGAVGFPWIVIPRLQLQTGGVQHIGTPTPFPVFSFYQLRFKFENAAAGTITPTVTIVPILIQMKSFAPG